MVPVLSRYITRCWQWPSETVDKEVGTRGQEGDTDEIGGSGGASIAGYEYQIDVPFG